MGRFSGIGNNILKKLWSDLMEKPDSIFNDERLMAFWLQQREDSLRALQNANRQIAYLSNFVTRGLVEPENEAGWIERGYD